MALHTLDELRQRQALPLEVKIRMSEQRIREWVYEFGLEGVYISFSGGKDSTALLHLARRLYPDIKALFIDTGLEYPEIRDFVKTFDNVDAVRPKLTFKQVIQKYGYPFISKRVCDSVGAGRKTATKLGINTPEELTTLDVNNLNERLAMLAGRYNEWFVNKRGHQPTKNGSTIRNQNKYAFMLFSDYNFSSLCCNVMKKAPAKAYAKRTGRHPITAQMAAESELRTQKWLENGCNGFNMASPISNPFSFWTEQDILTYIKQNNITICSVYGDIVPDNTARDALAGQLDIADYGLINDTRPLKTTGCSRTGCMFCGFGCHLEKEGEGRFERMKITHPKQYDYIMRPADRGGLDFKNIIDWLNKNGNLNIRY